jgi:hypothetical protein
MAANPLTIATVRIGACLQLTFDRLYPYKPRTSGKLPSREGLAVPDFERSLRIANPRRAAHRGIK